MAGAAPKIDFVSDAFKRDPGPMLHALRVQGPVARGRLPLLGECWLPVSYEAVGTVLKDADRFVVDARNAGRGRFDAMRIPLPRSIQALADNMLGHDDPPHRRLRGLVERAFRRQRVADLRGGIAAVADARLDALAAAIARDGRADLIDAYARPIPLAVICDLLGLPVADRARFSRWAAGLAEAASAVGLLRALPALRRLGRYLRDQFERCRREGGTGLLAALVEAEEAGDRLSGNELLSMALLLLLAGHETTVHLISGGVVALLGRDDAPAWPADPADAASAVDELLRVVTPVQMTKPRYAAEDTELCGRRIARGEALMPVLAAANADPAVFDAPDALDLARRPNPHFAFGSGVHSCLGLQLARAEAEVAFARLFERLPKLRLAQPAAELRYTRRLGIRALRELPVAVS